MVYAPSLWPSKHLTEADLQGFECVMTIKGVTLEKIENGSGSEQKGVVYFYECERGMVLNKTNGERIMRLHGDETEYWRNERIALYPSEANLGGRVVKCIRVREAAPDPNAPTGLPPTHMQPGQPAPDPRHHQPYPVQGQPFPAGAQPNGHPHLQHGQPMPHHGGPAVAPHPGPVQPAPQQPYPMQGDPRVNGNAGGVPTQQTHGPAPEAAGVLGTSPPESGGGTDSPSPLES